MTTVDKKVEKVFKDYEKIITIQQEILDKREDTNRILLEGKMFHEEINACLAKQVKKYETLVKYYRAKREPINLKRIICSALEEYEEQKKNNAVSKALREFLTNTKEKLKAEKKDQIAKSKQKKTGKVVQLFKKRKKKK